MKVFRSWEDAARSGEVRRLALGFFDGVHRGHRLVFDAVREPCTTPSTSSSSNFSPTSTAFSVLTFWPHPQAILSPGQEPPLITGIEHKLRLFAAAGAASTLLIPFDLVLASLTADAFLDLLHHHLPNLEAVACGQNFHFGHGRTGDASHLRAWANGLGISGLIPQMQRDRHGQAISSSSIRNLLREGRLEEASHALGRPYSLWGQVVQGRQLGRQLGFPTANLQTGDQLFLPAGVYAGRVVLENGDTYTAALNIGRRPTVEGSGGLLQVEAHLLGYNGGELYGQHIDVQPIEFIRAERSFTDHTELRKQIADDVLEAGRRVG
ncbi:MAG: riboflavin biosynthesis protein RibF [Candidatus Methylacidiphilales bacterium]|nr:riboflavin biosynthesis protein RibF [Candidatus Methylacidiphilales bacterium]